MTVRDRTRLIGRLRLFLCK